MTQDKLNVIYAREPIPLAVTKSIFLAGPTPRNSTVKSWRPGAIKILEALGFNGHVYVPEDRGGIFKGDYTDQVEWESKALSAADVIVFWVPRNMQTMPALTTNVEWGIWADSGKAVLGCPPEAENVRYMQVMAERLKVPVAQTLDGVLTKALELLGDGAFRVNGEVTVPLLVWTHPTFQLWYASQKAAGNRLESAKVLWNFRVGPNREKVFCWVLHVEVWIASENRIKSNEFVLGRTDLSAITLFYRPEDKKGTSDYFFDTEVLLVREFRSPARTHSGDILELPGGSSKENLEPLQTALAELEEETSFSVNPLRVFDLGTRQVAGTLAAHATTLFFARLTEEERDQLRATSASGKTFGVETDTERTHIELTSIRQILSSPSVDWATLGMILASILTNGTHK